MSENAQTKGLRLLVDGRLTVKMVDPGSGLIVAECKGDNGLYDLGWDPWKKEWRCTCEARTKCSHLWALTTITVPPRESGARSATAGSQSLGQGRVPRVNGS